MRFEDFKIFKSIPTIKTERLTLRKLKKRDLDDIFEYASDPRVSRYLLWSPHASRRVSAAYLTRVLSLYKKGQFYDWAIVYSGKMIGICGFSSIDVLADCAEIGYVINADYWGQGIATEVARRVMDFGFNRLELQRIEARYIEGNEASASVMKKCGMSQIKTETRAISEDGEQGVIVTYGISAEEYFKNNS